MVRNPYIILQARMNSERLPGKVMKNVSGKPLIGILFDRIKSPEVPILMATSINHENDELADYALANGVEVFRGSENNVLERFYCAAKSVNADLIFRLTADNPFVEARLIKNVLNSYLSNYDLRNYISTSLSHTFPLGISVEAFSYVLLEEAYLNASLPGELEHVTPYMHQNTPGDIKIVDFHGNTDRHHYRLTVDTAEDFELVRCLVEDHGCALRPIEEIVKVLDENPGLAILNQNVVQKTWD